MRATEFIVEANSLPDGIAAAEQSGVKLMPLPGSDFKMVQISGRPIVVANVNGFPSLEIIMGSPPPLKPASPVSVLSDSRWYPEQATTTVMHGTTTPTLR